MVKLVYIGDINKTPKKDLVEMLRREDINQTTKMSVAVEILRRSNKLLHFDWILEILGNCFQECDFCNKLNGNLETIEIFNPFDVIGNSYELCESCAENLYDVSYCELAYNIYWSF